jgi:hypothetical protein
MVSVGVRILKLGKWKALQHYISVKPISVQLLKHLAIL